MWFLREMRRWNRWPYTRNRHMADRMRKESVVFAAGVLRREAHLRPDTKPLWAQKNALVVPFWHKMPLMRQAGGLAFCTTADPVFDADRHPCLFLGLSDENAPIFAVDVDDWKGAIPTDEAVMPWSGGAVPCAEIEGTEFHDLRSLMTQLTPWEAEVAATARGILEWHGRHRFCANCGAPTKMSDGGWRRDCAACSAHHFPRTDPVVIMLVTHGNSVLLGRNAAWPEGMYSLLAGFMEPGEPIEAAVRREVLEESGVVIGAVDYVASQPWPFPASLMIGCRAEALTREITLDPNELEDALWVTREELSVAMAGLSDKIRPARKGALAQFLLTKWLADCWE